MKDRNRREFLKDGLAVTAGVVASGMLGNTETVCSARSAVDFYAYLHTVVDNLTDDPGEMNNLAWGSRKRANLKQMQELHEMLTAELSLV